MNREQKFTMGFNALVADATGRITKLDSEGRANLEKALAVEPSDAVMMLNLNAEAFAMDKIPLAISARVYAALSPLGWRKGVPLGERVMVLTLVNSVIAEKVATYGK